MDAGRPRELEDEVRGGERLSYDDGVALHAHRAVSLPAPQHRKGSA